MCISCYEEFGEPKDFHDKTDQCVNLINKIYEYHSAGSNLHIVIDDWNLDDQSILFCKNQSLRDTDNRIKDVEVKLCDFLLSMSVAQRATVMAIQEGFIK